MHRRDVAKLGIYTNVMERPMPEKISVLLVDDHSLVRRGFRRILEDEPDMEVAGEAGDGEEAVKLAKQLHPKVVLMDCALRHLSGLQATRQILEALPDTLILMLSMHEEERSEERRVGKECRSRWGAYH